MLTSFINVWTYSSTLLDDAVSLLHIVVSIYPSERTQHIPGVVGQMAALASTNPWLPKEILLYILQQLVVDSFVQCSTCGIRVQSRKETLLASWYIHLWTGLKTHSKTLGGWLLYAHLLLRSPPHQRSTVQSLSCGTQSALQVHVRKLP